jgi:hypothetical protein
VTAPAEVTVGALQLPAELAPRVVAALRDQYASVVVGQVADDDVPAAVLRYVIESSLQAYEAKVAAVDVDAAIEKVRTESRERVERAREKARRDVEAIRATRRTPAKKAAPRKA